jgi:hypothetical protein
VITRRINSVAGHAGFVENAVAKLGPLPDEGAT